jgi:hypothetical protein
MEVVISISCFGMRTVVFPIMKREDGLGQQKAMHFFTRFFGWKRKKPYLCPAIPAEGFA